MKTLRFSGYSDDTFGEWTTGIDYDNCASGKPITFKVTAGRKAVYVTGQYNRKLCGCWDVAVSQVEEGNYPDFPMQISFEAYTAVLEMEVPDETIVEHIDEKEFEYDLD